ncbi:MAG: hypothetical protein CSA65_03600 [Proteobacteria bacterium]|nr:MAG: hypothetical protein CSA65_03600 [Pseudomonadota bacterium]
MSTLRLRKRARNAPLAIGIVSVVSAAFGVACSSEDTPAETQQPLAAHCNPLSREHCFLPWPSSFYLKADATTKTGYRVAYDAKALPANNKGKPIDPTRHNLRDGFSVGAQPILWLPGGVSVEGLASLDDPGPSITADHPIWLISMPGGERVPFFAEVDANATIADDKQGLVLRPLRPFEANTRYVVAVRDSVRDAAGEPLAAPEAFARLRDGLETADATLEGQRETVEEILTFLESKGLERGELVLAWDFRTQSKESATSQLVTLVDDGLAKLPSAGPTYTITEQKDYDASDEPYIWRTLVGTYDVPSYLKDDGPDAVFDLDAEGKPRYRGMQPFEFRVHIPRCALTATKPLPVLIFGHGLFRDAHYELLDSYHKTFTDTLCMVEVSGTWIGLSAADLSSVATQVLPDFSNLPRVTDQIQQAHLNMHVLVELALGSLRSDPALKRGDGSAITDGKEVYYYGISNGGIQGFTFAALQKRVERFALNVPGGWWSMMMERSSDFQLLALGMKSVYPDPLDRLITIMTSQAFFDPTDPINYTSYHRDGPLPGRSAKKLLLQEGRYDDEVSNITTRALVRAAGLPLLKPAVVSVWGIEEANGPLDSAYTQWDITPPEQPPKANKPATKLAEKVSAHKVPRRLVYLVEQLRRFFRPDGRIEATCDGKACVCKATVDCKTIAEDEKAP